jgi:hypothetical protein
MSQLDRAKASGGRLHFDICCSHAYIPRFSLVTLKAAEFVPRFAHESCQLCPMAFEIRILAVGFIN